MADSAAPSDSTKAMLEQAFAVFDKDANGKLSAAEMMGILTRSGGGKPLAKADAEAIIALFDTDQDGQLDMKASGCLLTLPGSKA